MNTNETTINSTDAVATVTEHCMAITFRYKGWLYTLVADPSGDDFFIDHLTGRHLTYDPSPGSFFNELTDEFNKRELWNV